MASVLCWDQIGYISKALLPHKTNLIQHFGASLISISSMFACRESCFGGIDRKLSLGSCRECEWSWERIRLGQMKWVYHCARERERESKQRILAVGGRFTVRLVSSLTELDLKKQECMYWNHSIQTSQTGDKLYSDTSPYGECYMEKEIPILEVR